MGAHPPSAQGLFLDFFFKFWKTNIFDFFRYFQGDVRAASYEGYGTDVYIYLNALAGEAVEMLPVWSPTASDKVAFH